MSLFGTPNQCLLSSYLPQFNPSVITYSVPLGNNIHLPLPIFFLTQPHVILNNNSTGSELQQLIVEKDKIHDKPEADKNNDDSNQHRLLAHGMRNTQTSFCQGIFYYY